MDIDDPDARIFRFVRLVPILSNAPLLRKDPTPKLGQNICQILKGLIGISYDYVTSLAQKRYQNNKQEVECFLFITQNI